MAFSIAPRRFGGRKDRDKANCHVIIIHPTIGDDTRKSNTLFHKLEDIPTRNMKIEIWKIMIYQNLK